MERKRNARSLASLILFAGVLSLALFGCGGGSAGGGSGEGSEGGNLLQEIEDRGTIRASTDPAYPPQSFLNDQGEYEGFDIDVTEEIAKRMGVEVQWMTPSWDVLTAGSWTGRWDISVGSMTITPERSDVLYFSPPYYYTPAAVAVHESNTDITNLETDLDGKRIGVCSRVHLRVLPRRHAQHPRGLRVRRGRPADTDLRHRLFGHPGPGASVTASGWTRRCSSLDHPPGGGQDSGTPIKIVGDPLYYEPLAVAFDKEAPADPQPLVDEVSRIVEEMHEDGTLTELSKKWYDGTDLTVKQGG